jgi:hypothetical protein
MFPVWNGLKQEDALWPFPFKFVLDYAIRRVHIKQNVLKLSSIRQILVFSNDVNILGGSVHTKMEHTEAWVVASKEIGLEVNADKTK